MSDNNTKQNTAKTYSGLEKAAIILMSLSEDEASGILQHIEPKKIQEIGAAMSEIDSVDKDKLDTVATDFLEIIGTKTAIGINRNDYIRDVIKNAVGEDNAKNMLDNILKEGNSKGIDTLKWMDPAAVADLIKYEHPQIQAVILSYLNPSHAAEVMKNLDQDNNLDLIYRISSLESISPRALTDLNNIIEKQFSQKTGLGEKKIGGVQITANIMDKLDSSVEEEIMTSIKENDPDLGQQIQEMMFVFENIVSIDDRGIQVLLREVSTDVLIVSLKGASEDIREKIFKNMSKRAAELLKDDIEAKGPVKVSEVEVAQKEILTIARRLADEGEISLGGKGEEMIT